MNSILKLNNLGKVARYEYNEEKDLIGKQLTKYGCVTPVWSEILNAFPSLEINIGALLSLIGILSKDELLYLIALSKIIIYHEHVFYIGIKIYDYDGIHMSYSISNRDIETIADIEFMSNYLDISQIECLDLVNKFIELNIIKEKHIVDKNKEIIYIVNPEIFCNSYYPNHDPMGLYEIVEIELTYYDVFCRRFEKLDNGKYILNPNDTYEDDINKEECGRSSKEYREWKQSVLERDNYTCQCCESTLNPDVHHILNYAQYKELRTDVENGIVLCECCHSPMIKGSYHNTFGTRNNRRDQLQLYINTKRQELNLPPKTI